MSHPTAAPGGSPTEAEFIEVASSEEFGQLRSKFRGFVFPLFFAFIAWYVIYIVSATFFPDAMATSVYDNINLGMVLGLAQFATAGLITWGYVKFADNKLDPASERIRATMEGRAASAANSAAASSPTSAPKTEEV